MGDFAALRAQASQFLGEQLEYTIRIDDRTHVLARPASDRFEPGAQLFLELPASELTAWPTGG